MLKANRDPFARIIRPIMTATSLLLTAQIVQPSKAVRLHDMGELRNREWNGTSLKTRGIDRWIECAINCMTYVINIAIRVAGWLVGSTFVR